MSGSGGQKSRRRGERDIVEPPAERLAHGVVLRLKAAIVDVEGRAGLPWRALDTLARMERQGSITAPMRRAGDRFHDLFRIAALDGLHAADPMRIPVQCNCSRNVRTHVRGSERARQAVLAALETLGGIESPSGSCAWHVLGCEMTIEEWAFTCGWAGRRITRDMGAGILVSGLAILKQHYDL
jgi:hypothetical protein